MPSEPGRAPASSPRGVCWVSEVWDGSFSGPATWMESWLALSFFRVTCHVAGLAFFTAPWSQITGLLK